MKKKIRRKEKVRTRRPRELGEIKRVFEKRLTSRAVLIYRATTGRIRTVGLGCTAMLRGRADSWSTETRFLATEINCASMVHAQLGPQSCKTAHIHTTAGRGSEPTLGYYWWFSQRLNRRALLEAWMVGRHRPAPHASNGL